MSHLQAESLALHTTKGQEMELSEMEGGGRQLQLVGSRSAGPAVTWEMFLDRLGRAEWGQAGAHTGELATGS